MAVSVVTAATAESLTAEEIRAWLRMESQDEDSLIESTFKACREYAETVCKRRLINTTMRLSMLGFYDKRYAGKEDGLWTIRVPEPPLQSVSSVTYLDSNGTSTVLASSDYSVDIYAEPGRITPAYNTVWPETRHIRNSVTIQYVAGYGGASATLAQSIAAVPESVNLFLKFAVAGVLEKREPSAEASCKAVEYLLDPVQWGSYV